MTPRPRNVACADGGRPVVEHRDDILDVVAVFDRLGRHAHEAPPLEGVERVVVVAPHPDDEVLACGLLLATAAVGGLDVRVIAVTDGEAAYPGEDPIELARVRRSEQITAVAELGLPACVLHRLEVPDGAVDRHMGGVSAAIRRHCDRRTLLIAPSIQDWHPDHVACGMAARPVAGSSAGMFWSSLFWALHHPERLIATDPPLIRFAGTIDAHRARARAIVCHRSQFQSPTGGPAPILTDHLVAHFARPAELYVRESP